jgi:hypothetical protein
VALGHGCRVVSKDLTGFAAEELSSRLPGRPIVVYLNGACGNLNPAKVGVDFDGCRLIGEAIARSALEALGDGVEVGSGVASIEGTLTVSFTSLHGDDLDALVSQLRRDFENVRTPWTGRTIEALDRWESAMRKESPAAIDLRLQAMRIGSVRYACFGAEVFSVAREALSERADSPVRIVGCANGDIGYLAPIPAYDDGGYEVASAFVYYGTPPIAPGAFEAAVEAMSGLLSRLR